MAHQFIDDMIHLCRRPVVYCKNPTCDRVRLEGSQQNGVPVDISRVDPDWPVERFERALTCTHCDSRQVAVKWVQYDRPSVYWTEERDKARVARGSALPAPSLTSKLP